MSYFEWLQNKRCERWEMEAVYSKLERRMQATVAAAFERAAELDRDLRTACYAVALERLRAIYERRGIWP